MERYLVYKEFNTKDWIVYDNITNHNIVHCDTEQEANDYMRKIGERSDENDRNYCT